MLVRPSVSKKLACGDLFRQDTFPLRLRRGRGNVQGNLAAQGFRIHRTCRWIRISFGGDGGKRVPCGHLREAQSDPKESTETSGGRGQRPPRRLRLRVCGPPSLPKGLFDSLRRTSDACPPQTVEKPLILGRAAFLAPFGRSQRSRNMLRHKALGLCPKPRQARREASALWAVATEGGKATRSGAAKP